jgi:hypothetical protein
MRWPWLAAIVVLLPNFAGAQAPSPQAASDLTADPRARGPLDSAMKCSVQRVADYINSGSQEPAQVLGSAAIQYCYERWKIAAAARAKIGPEYGIPLNSLEHLKIIEDSYFSGVTAAAVEFRLSRKYR